MEMKVFRIKKKNYAVLWKHSEKCFLSHLWEETGELIEIYGEIK